MENKFSKYQIISESDKKWGFYINSLGRTVIDKNTPYPSLNHPNSYIFNWQKGRILKEYHLVLITKGEGIFENKVTGSIKVSNGDALLIFPNEWHRYKPKKNIGWTERWVGFSGKIAEHIFDNNFFNRENPIISGCNKASILNNFNELFRLYDEESFGYQKIASGICIQLLAELYNIQIGGTQNLSVKNIVIEAKKEMYKNIKQNIDLKKIANNLGIGYSKFRIDFKKQTGSSPMQYFLSLKIEKAKELLLNTNKSQKEIAFEIGFQSDYYFNRLFKKKTGLTPGKFRNSVSRL